VKNFSRVNRIIIEIVITQANIAQIDTSPPKHFTAKAVFLINACGVFLLIPIGIAVLLTNLSLIFFPSLAFCVSVLLLAAILPIYFFPLGLGNYYVTRLTKRFHPNTIESESRFTVQVALSPRIKFGIRAFMEDADDVGYLFFTSTSIIFEGDSIKLSLPFNQIERIDSKNIGWRGLWICGPRLVVTPKGLPNVTSLVFAERSSLALPSSRRTAKNLYRCLSRKLPSA
jgi:hypothetical protein